MAEAISSQISTIKKIENELRIEKDSLEEQVQERTIELKKELDERKQAEEDLQRSERELKIRNRIADIFLMIPDDEMYGEVLQVVLGIMESPYGTFAYINEDGDRIVPSMTRDIWDECKMPDKGIFFPRDTWGDTLWARCLIEKISFSSNGPFKIPNGHIQVKRALATPIIYQGKSIGNLMVGDKPMDYKDEDIKLLETISDHIAPILHARLQNEIHEKKRKIAEDMLRRAHKELERRVQDRTEALSKANALLNQEITQHKKSQEILERSEAELRKLSSRLLSAHEEERRYIGNELHDGLAQTMAAIKVWVESALVQMNQKKTSEVAKSLETLVPIAQGAVEEVRRISMRLRPSILEDLGIVPTISWLCKDFMMLYPGIDIEKQIGIEENDVSESLKIVIFRVLQEALNNITKHSQANLVRISLNKDENALALTINDNGVGFDSEQISNGEQFIKGLGLASMRERTTLSGGSFLIESQKGKGTRIQASWV